MGDFPVGGSTNGINYIFWLPIENGTSTTVPWSDGRSIPHRPRPQSPYLRRHGLTGCDAIFLLGPVSSLGMVNVARQNARVGREEG